MGSGERRLRILTPGRRGAAGDDPVRLRELARDAVEMTAHRGKEGALRRAGKRALGVEPPPIGAWREGRGLTVMGFGPGLWSIVGPAGADFADLRAAVGAHAAVVETGHGLAWFELSGARAAHVLAKGCRLDLHPRAFGSDACARTVIAQVPATIWRTGDRPCFGLAVPLTFAQSFAHFLLASAAEAGCEVLPQEDVARGAP